MEVKAIVKLSFSNQHQERDEMIRQLEISSTPIDKKQAKRLRRMKQAEETKQVFEKIKFLRTKGHRRYLTRLEIPKNPEDDPRECEEWQTIEISTVILAKMQERNQLHFGQSQGTPFTIATLLSDIGYRGDTQAANDILDGKYEYTKLAQGDATYTNELKLLVQYMQRTEGIQMTEDCPTIMKSEFQDKLKAWRE